MIEVPSAVIMADILAKEVDFFSIGTNDLIQFSLAVDRGNKDVANLYDPLNPAILRIIKQLVDVGKDTGINIYMCGEMAGDPINIPLLLGMQLDQLSMNPQSIPHIKRVIRSLSVSDARSFLQETLKKKTARGVFGLVQEAYGDILKEQAF